MDITEQVKSCKNCKYFKQHYVKNTYYFTPIYCGHCTNKNFRIKDKRKNFPYLQGCELWEADDENVVDYKKIDSVLRSMEEVLISIRQIIKDDNQN